MTGGTTGKPTTKNNMGVQNFYWYKGGLSKEDLEKFRRASSYVPMRGGGTVNTGEGLEVVESYRRSKIGWLPKLGEDEHAQKFDWVYKTLFNLAKDANEKMWNFQHDSLGDSTEHIQYSIYNEEQQGHYDWHVDVGSKGVAEKRKISVVVQLSDPNDYEGGDLQVMMNRDIQTIPRNEGNVIVFPPYFLHRVTPVTRGVRESLVWWISGEPLK